MKVRGLWGLTIEPSETHKLKNDVSCRITLASLRSYAVDKRTTVYMVFGDQNCTLCSLTPGKIEQQVIEITCLAGESVEFYSEGPNVIQLMGNYISQGDDDSEEQTAVQISDPFFMEASIHEPSSIKNIDKIKSNSDEHNDHIYTDYIGGGSESSEEYIGDDSFDVSYICKYLDSICESDTPKLSEWPKITEITDNASPNNIVNDEQITVDQNLLVDKESVHDDEASHIEEEGRLNTADEETEKTETIAHFHDVMDTTFTKIKEKVVASLENNYKDINIITTAKKSNPKNAPMKSPKSTLKSLPKTTPKSASTPLLTPKATPISTTKAKTKTIPKAKANNIPISTPKATFKSKTKAKAKATPKSKSQAAPRTMPTKDTPKSGSKIKAPPQPAESKKSKLKKSKGASEPKQLMTTDSIDGKANATETNNEAAKDTKVNTLSRKVTAKTGKRKVQEAISKEVNLNFEVPQEKALSVTGKLSRRYPKRSLTDESVRNLELLARADASMEASLKNKRRKTSKTKVQ